MDAVAELRFTPSQAARSLAEGRHAANGIVFPDLSGPYFAEVVLGYEEVAGELDRSVLILSTHGRSAAREVMLDLAGRVDGMVVLGRTVGDDVLGEIADSGLPLVLIARGPIAGVGAVRAENLRGPRPGRAPGRPRLPAVRVSRRPRDVDGRAERWDGFQAGLSAGGAGAAAAASVRLRRGSGVRRRPRAGRSVAAAGRAGLRERRDRARCDERGRGAGAAACRRTSPSPAGTT